jgi:hypothetical protein
MGGYIRNAIKNRWVRFAEMYIGPPWTASEAPSRSKLAPFCRIVSSRHGGLLKTHPFYNLNGHDSPQYIIIGIRCTELSTLGDDDPDRADLFAPHKSELIFTKIALLDDKDAEPDLSVKLPDGLDIRNEE